MITEEMVGAADAAVEETRGRIRRLELSADPETLRQCEVLLGRAVANAADVRARKAVQDAALERRADAERLAPGVAGELAAELESGREAVVEAARVVQGAVGCLLDAVGAYGDVVGRARERLEGLGWPAAEGDAEFETGYGGAGAVRVRGEWWGPLPGDSVLALVVAAGVRGRLGERHPLVSVRGALTRARSSVHGRALLARVEPGSGGPVGE